MERLKIIECIDFFNKLSINEKNVTSDDEKALGKLVVEVDYTFEGKTYTTNKLYYQEINPKYEDYFKRVEFPNRVISFFKEPVYWIDTTTHHWQISNDNEENKEKIKRIIEDEIIPYISVNNEEFALLLTRLVNNRQTGFIQLITDEGSERLYGRTLVTNNHWHDLVVFIQKIIKNGGKKVNHENYSRLLYKWNASLVRIDNAQIGYGIITKLIGNIHSVQNPMKTKATIELLKYKKQIILQGPPGTGKTRKAQEIAYHVITGESIPDTNREEALNNLFASGQYKLIQFHPAYSYEDFVRGIVAESNGTTISYRAKDKHLALFAKAASESPEKMFVLVIDEINRANLPEVLGELILALEYRNTLVETVYEIDGTSQLKLPDNLFIIGTMNTADRSVGHIDYAIRRRFAFVSIPPDEEVVINVTGQNSKAHQLFKKVDGLFQNPNNLAPDFAIEDVQIGHSYFLEKDEEKLRLKLEFEIKPILLEYYKDGILLHHESDEKPTKDLIISLSL